MAKILLVYGTTEGTTRDIAHHMATTAHDEANEVEVLDSLNLEPSVLKDPWDAVIIGGSVHQGIHQTYLTEVVKNNRAWLSQRPGAFFSVSLSAAVQEPIHQQEARAYLESFLTETGWQPQAKTCIAGALRYAEYDYFKRLVLKYLSAQLGPGIVTGHDIIYTNWDEVTRFTQSFLQAIKEPQKEVTR
jgi:menaquinone-dependent protoporphyrinogen oxidase